MAYWGTIRRVFCCVLVRCSIAFTPYNLLVFIKYRAISNLFPTIESAIELIKDLNFIIIVSCFVKLFDNDMNKVKRIIKKLAKLGYQAIMFDTMKKGLEFYHHRFLFYQEMQQYISYLDPMELFFVHLYIYRYCLSPVGMLLHQTFLRGIHHPKVAFWRLDCVRQLWRLMKRKASFQLLHISLCLMSTMAYWGPQFCSNFIHQLTNTLTANTNSLRNFRLLALYLMNTSKL